MALPANLTTIVCRLDSRQLNAGVASSGRLVAVPNFRATITDPGSGLPVLLVGPATAPVRADLVDGVASVTLVATDDPDATYSGTPTWTVYERFAGGRDPWQLEVPYDGGPIDLATAPPAVAGEIVATYVLTTDDRLVDATGATDGYVWTADGADGAGWEAPTGGGGGASALDDLTDVATAGAATGEALVYGGSSWGPSSAAVVLTGDARLSDARTPTAHKTSHATGGGDALTAADVGAATSGHDHSGVYDPSGTASSAVSAHLGAASHVALASTTPAALTPDIAGAVGVGTTSAKADHVHNVPAAAPSTTLTPATSNAEGSGSSFARSDHTHAVAKGTPVALGSAAAEGSAASFARSDHVHPFPAAADVGAAAASHQHAAGDITSGTVATARLGSGSASASTFLRGDQTWATPSGGGGSSDPLDGNVVISARVLGR